MRYRGTSVSEIAKKYGICRYTIYRFAKELGRLPTEAEIKERYGNPEDMEKLISESGFTKQHIHMIRKKFGRLPTLNELKGENNE